jgi:hypothetical protein
LLKLIIDKINNIFDAPIVLYLINIVYTYASSWGTCYNYTFIHTFLVSNFQILFPYFRQVRIRLVTLNRHYTERREFIGTDIKQDDVIDKNDSDGSDNIEKSQGFWWRTHEITEKQIIEML